MQFLDTEGLIKYTQLLGERLQSKAISNPKFTATTVDGILDELADEVEQDIGELNSNEMWYLGDNTFQMNANYTLIGKMCFMSGTAKVKGGWQKCYYSLPVVPLSNIYSITANSSNQIIKVSNETIESNNTVICFCRQDNQNHPSDEVLNFTLIYQYLD